MIAAVLPPATRAFSSRLPFEVSVLNPVCANADGHGRSCNCAMCPSDGYRVGFNIWNKKIHPCGSTSNIY